jgi:hypothetical protein
MKNFQIPTSSEHYIVFQRTTYKSFFGKLMKKVGLEKFYDYYLSSVVERCRTRQIAEKYFSDLESDYSEIKKYLPERVRNILDIGSGMAGIDVFLFNHYQNFEPNLYLLDKEGTSEIYYNFKGVAAYYNSFDLAKKLLEINEVPNEKINTIDIDKEKFSSKNKFDLVISLISWGFHYPVSTYIENVCESLSKEGRLIIDVRKYTSGERELRSVFNTVEIISNNQKYLRLVCYN